MRGRLATLWFALLLVLNYAVPYTLLEEHRKMTGAYLFWPLITLIVALSCFALMRRWRAEG
ncbi:MAG: hypothetical protein N3H31_04780 [Candidatus Nezhaarchaeota archaeon]|nr:hypothetical protein [Candidatus Nezhaarchaeota archaeon]